MDLEIEFERENDGRWIAEIPSLPGVMVYGITKDEARSKVQALALHVIGHLRFTPDPYPPGLRQLHLVLPRQR